MAFIVEDLGTMPYRQAWALQEAANERVAAGEPEHLFLVEHPPVITFGRRRADHHVVAPVEQLSQLGIEAIATDRGGDVTFHGPGQLVAYPIVRLIDHRLSVGAYVRRLEDVVIATLARFGIEGLKDESAIGVWVHHHDARDAAEYGMLPNTGCSGHVPPSQVGWVYSPTVSSDDPHPSTRGWWASTPTLHAAEQSSPMGSHPGVGCTPEHGTDREVQAPPQAHRGDDTLAKICALGVRIRRGVSMHGIALNVDTDLRQFELIVPCGIGDRAVTSMKEMLGSAVPTMQEVKMVLVEEMDKGF